MPATRSAARRNRLKHFIAVLVLLGLMVELAACRGFFGQAPIALLIASVPVEDGEAPVTVIFDISGSNDPDGTIVSYELNYGDGSPKKTGTAVPAAKFTYDYMAGGTYTVTLTVTDNDGRIGMDTKIVVIGPAMITFASNRGAGGDYDIWRMKADGTDLQVVLNVNHDALFPDLVRRTRGKIAYAMETVGWNIYTMTVEGLSNIKLTPQTASNQIQPSWSYDGTKIAYASNAAQTPSQTTWEIYTVNADGTNPQTSLITQTPSWAPAYSPVNNDLVFVSAKKADGTTAADGGSAILKRTAAGTLSTLHDSAGADGDVSPPVPGGLATPLNLPDGISKPAWSPDGTKIAFSTDKDAGVVNIYVMNADGTVVQRLEAYVNSLLASPVTAGMITSGNDEFCPYWLEDGSGLAFVRKVGVSYDLYKVSFTDGTVTPLTLTGDNVNPAVRDSRNGP